MSEFEHHRIYSSNELNRMGYSSNILTDLTRSGDLMRIQRGFYISRAGTDSLDLITQLFPEAILCLNSALCYYGYLDKMPEEFAIAVHKRHNRYKYTHSDLPVKAYFRDDKYIDLGVEKKLYRNRWILVYDKERTICDCIRRKDLLSQSDYRMAIQSYIRDKNKNVSRLMDYARILRISRKVRLIMEAWI